MRNPMHRLIAMLAVAGVGLSSSCGGGGGTPAAPSPGTGGGATTVTISITGVKGCTVVFPKSRGVQRGPDGDLAQHRRRHASGESWTICRWTRVTSRPGLRRSRCRSATCPRRTIVRFTRTWSAVSTPPRRLLRRPAPGIADVDGVRACPAGKVPVARLAGCAQAQRDPPNGSPAGINSTGTSVRSVLSHSATSCIPSPRTSCGRA